MNERRAAHPEARPGRGATTNPHPRFLPVLRDVFDDGWTDEDAVPPALATTVTSERTREIVSRNQSPDVAFDASVNPYKGCEHGCVYCFARPTHAYLDLSPGLDFESRLVAKPGAADALRATFRRRRYRPEVIALGVNTDAYQPIERDLGLTRALLEVFVEFRHPVTLVTKSQLIRRDLDLLGELAAHDLVSVCVSITSLDRKLARTMEPRASAPERRLETVAALAGAGVPVTVLIAPVIPSINDHELERILEAGRAAGAVSAGWVFVRLPLEIKEIFEAWLREHFPDRADKVLNQIRASRGGKLYDSSFGTRMRGTGAFADLLDHRFDRAFARLGFAGRDRALRTDLFRVPAAAGDQLGLFDPK